MAVGSSLEQRFADMGDAELIHNARDLARMDLSDHSRQMEVRAALNELAHRLKQGKR